MRMSEGMKPTRPERNIWHMEAGDARPDASSEPEPLIAPGSVVGLWLVEHLPVVHPHDHAFYEMALVLSGSGFHVCGDSEEPVQAGTVVFVPPGVAHGYRGCRDMEVYNCFFRAELAEFELLWAARDDDLVALFGRSGTRRPQDDHVVMEVDRAAFEQCVGELDAIRHEDPSERSHARQIGHLLLALDLIARHGRRYGQTAPERRLATPRVVAAVLDAFDADLARHWTLADLSTEVYVGSFHLAHRVQALDGRLADGLPRPASRETGSHPAGRDRRLDRIHRAGRRLAGARGILAAVLEDLRRQPARIPAAARGAGRRLMPSRADEDQSIWTTPSIWTTWSIWRWISPVAESAARAPDRAGRSQTAPELGDEMVDNSSCPGARGWPRSTIGSRRSHWCRPPHGRWRRSTGARRYR